HRGGSFFWGYSHYFIFAALGALGAGLGVVAKSAGGHSSVSPALAVASVSIPVAIYLVSLVVAHLPILPGIAVHVWIVAPAAIAVLALPLAAPTLGVPVVLGAVALIVVLAVTATLMLARRKIGAMQ
ncbi:MAG TPA: low temperature requirement protein A, partial [Galbitalea sp.]